MEWLSVFLQGYPVSVNLNPGFTLNINNRDCIVIIRLRYIIFGWWCATRFFFFFRCEPVHWHRKCTKTSAQINKGQTPLLTFHASFLMRTTNHPGPFFPTLQSPLCSQTWLFEDVCERRMVGGGGEGWKRKSTLSCQPLLECTSAGCCTFAAFHFISPTFIRSQTNTAENRPATVSTKPATKPAVGKWEMQKCRGTWTPSAISWWRSLVLWRDAIKQMKSARRRRVYRNKPVQGPSLTETWAHSSSSVGTFFDS